MFDGSDIQVSVKSNFRRILAAGEEKPKLGGPKQPPGNSNNFVLRLKHLNKSVEAYQKLGSNF